MPQFSDCVVIMIINDMQNCDINLI